MKYFAKGDNIVCLLLAPKNLCDNKCLKPKNNGTAFKGKNLLPEGTVFSFKSSPK